MFSHLDVEPMPLGILFYNENLEGVSALVLHHHSIISWWLNSLGLIVHGSPFELQKRTIYSSLGRWIEGPNARQTVIGPDHPFCKAAMRLDMRPSMASIYWQKTCKKWDVEVCETFIVCLLYRWMDPQKLNACWYLIHMWMPMRVD